MSSRIVWGSLSPSTASKSQKPLEHDLGDGVTIRFTGYASQRIANGALYKHRHILREPVVAELTNGQFALETGPQNARELMGVGRQQVSLAAAVSYGWVPARPAK